MLWHARAVHNAADANVGWSGLLTKIGYKLKQFFEIDGGRTVRLCLRRLSKPRAHRSGYELRSRKLAPSGGRAATERLIAA